MNRVEYITRKPHGNHPAGSKCLASRKLGLLVLEFENGDIVELPGHEFYCEGIEVRQVNHYDRLAEAIAREIDEEILGELMRIAEVK